MATTLYVIGFVVLPLAVVILVLGFDKLMARAAVAKRHHVWLLVAVTQIGAAVALAFESDFGVPFWIHAGAAAVLMAMAANERFRLASR